MKDSFNVLVEVVTVTRERGWLQCMDQTDLVFKRLQSDGGVEGFSLLLMYDGQVGKPETAKGTPHGLDEPGQCLCDFAVWNGWT